jgi:hypothetical protein
VAVTQTKVKYVIGCFVALSLTNLDQFYNLTVRCIVNTPLPMLPTEVHLFRYYLATFQHGL